MKNKPITTEINDAILKIRIPEFDQITKVGLLLHGYTGDESSMWVFSNKLPDDWLLIAPRAPYPTHGSGMDGFSWVDQPISIRPVYQDFLPAVAWLDEILNETRGRYFPNIDKLNLIGFSQGAAIAFAYTNANPAKVSKLSMLSGFLPDASEGFINSRLEENTKVFIGHGENDDIVPLERAQTAYQILSSKGISTQLCLSDVGHKLGSACFDAFESFMERG